MDNLLEILLLTFMSLWTYNIISCHATHGSTQRQINVGDKQANFHDDSVVQDKE